MVDISAVSAVATSIRAATDIAKGIFGLAVTAESQQQVVQLQLTLADALRQSVDDREERFALHRRIEELEAAIRLLSDQSAAVAKLRRQSPFYYADRDPDPYCPRCVEEHRRLVHMIVDSKQPTGVRHWLCPSCQIAFWEQRG